MTAATATSSRVRWAGLAGRPHGDEDADGRSFVFLHGLTFDHRMWAPVLQALPESHRAIAFDLPGHGASSALATRGLEPVAEAIHEAVVAAGLDAPIVVGHSIGGSLATIYAATYEAAAVVSVDAPLRFEPFAELLLSLAPQLRGDGFDEVWSHFRASMHAERLSPANRAPPARRRRCVTGGRARLPGRPPRAAARRSRAPARRRSRAAPSEHTPYLCALREPDRRFGASTGCSDGYRRPSSSSGRSGTTSRTSHEPIRFADLLTGLAAGLPPR